jgi:hypothetical protein
VRLGARERRHAERDGIAGADARALRRGIPGDGDYRFCSRERARNVGTAQAEIG